MIFKPKTVLIFCFLIVLTFEEERTLDGDVITPEKRQIDGPYDSIQTPHRIHLGLIVMRNERRNVYLDVAELAKGYLRDKKHQLLRWTVIEILNRTIDNSPREAVQEACELIQRGVSTIIFPGPSHLVTTVADIANNYSIPVIAPTATDPFLTHPIFRPYLLQMPPTDTHQSEAIAAILAEYGWIYFSILTSYDSYGINGMLKLQQIASDKKWKILNTQHFTVPKDLNDLDVTKELQVIKKSEARIIVLNCLAAAAKIVLESARGEFNMVGNGYMWIVTDGVVGNQHSLTMGNNLPDFNGMLGTLPSYRSGSMYSKFANLCVDNGCSGDISNYPFAAMVFDAVLIFGFALDAYLTEGNNLAERRIVCVHKSCQNEEEEHGPQNIPNWEFGDKIFQHLVKVQLDGAGRRYIFSESGESLNLNYSIMNFKDGEKFSMIGSYGSFHGEQSKLEFREKIIFMGKDNTVIPEYRPMTLKGRTLTLGINMEHPFISEHTIKCRKWNCTKTLPEMDNKGQYETGENITETCNEADVNYCIIDGDYCGKHSRNCTVPVYSKKMLLECFGTNCTQCNNSATCYECHIPADHAGGQDFDNCTWCEGNDCYNGYCIDLVEKIATELKFNYKFVMPRDGKWGGYDSLNKTWDGLVLDLLESYIDIATVHFSINAAREKDIDFSVPFMQVGLAVVVKAEVDSSNEFFFLKPFENTVWYCVILSAFLVTIIVCVYNKISPYGLYGRKMHALMTCPCDTCESNRLNAKDGRRSLIKYQEYSCLVEEVENYGEDRLELLNMSNSAWLVIASLLQQGPVEGAPYCLSGRTILSVWWFFMMILIAMYTANLAAFLTVTRMKIGIKDVEDLLDQNKLKWGTVTSTNPETLLKGSTKEEYRKLANDMYNVDTAEMGFARVKEGNYAFIYESALLEFMVQQTCDLVIAGDKFSKFGFAFGFPPNSPYLDLFNNVILKYRERNDLDKAWEDIKGSQLNCKEDEKDSSQSTSKLDMKNLSGLFTVIAYGILASFLFLLAEYTFACFEDVYGNEFPEESERPRNIQQALRRRLKLTWKDIFNHWFIFESFRKLRPPDDNEMIQRDDDNECEIAQIRLNDLCADCDDTLSSEIVHVDPNYGWERN